MSKSYIAAPRGLAAASAGHRDDDQQHKSYVANRRGVLLTIYRTLLVFTGIFTFLVSCTRQFLPGCVVGDEEVCTTWALARGWTGYEIEAVCAP